MKNKRFVLFIASVFAMICFSGCSDNDDYPTVGTLKVEVTSWNAYYENNTHMAIFPFGYEQGAIKVVDFGTNKIKEVDLNPGNYTVKVSVYGKEEHHWSGNAQVQAGRTELLQLGDSNN